VYITANCTNTVLQEEVTAVDCDDEHADGDRESDGESDNDNNNDDKNNHEDTDDVQVSLAIRLMFIHISDNYRSLMLLFHPTDLQNRVMQPLQGQQSMH
jgi:hypothetical protein